LPQNEKKHDYICLLATFLLYLRHQYELVNFNYQQLMKKNIQKLTVALLLTLVGGMNAWAQGVEKVTEFYLFVPGDNGSLPSYTPFTDKKDGTYSLELAVTSAMVSDNPLRFCISDHDGNSDGNNYGATIEQSIISETNHENIPLSIDGYVLQIP
jgi:hypothetical protein